MTPPLLQIEHLGFSHAPGMSPLFEDVDLSVEKGDFILIRGASGTGKSTLLRLVCRLASYTSGRIFFKGEPLEKIAPVELRSMVTYVAQIPSMASGSVRHNLLFPFSFAVNRARKEPSERDLSEMLEMFFLKDVGLEREASTLSIGQQQRLALMRAILLEPEMLLLDEPTSALDAESASMVLRIVERLNREQHRTVVMVTHSAYLPEGERSRTYLLENAKLRLL